VAIHTQSSLAKRALGGLATGLWVLLPSMCANIIDFDEVQNSRRLEGTFTSVYTWALKVGMALATFAVRPLLDNLTGFDAKLEGYQPVTTLWWIRALFAGIPVVALISALAICRFFPLTPARMAAIRKEREARRGTV